MFHLWDLCVASFATPNESRGAKALRLSCSRALKSLALSAAKGPARQRRQPLRAGVVAEPRLQPTDNSLNLSNSFTIAHVSRSQ
jgi:hypothetical protein